MARLKQPAGRQPKKPKQTSSKPVPVVIDRKTGLEDLVMPTLLQLESSGQKFWTQDQITKIIKLQSALQRKEVRLRSRDFSRLWAMQDGKCALTGAPLGRCMRFDVGIDKIDNKLSWGLRNARLVMLPLSYSRERAKRYNIKFGRVPDDLVDFPIARAVLLEIVAAIRDFKPVQNYAVDVFFPSRTELKHSYCYNNYPQVTMTAWVFPVARWHRREHAQPDKPNSNQTRVARIFVDDIDATLNIVGSRQDMQYSYALNNPAINFAEKTIEHLDHIFKSRLYEVAYDNLADWDYQS